MPSQFKKMTFELLFMTFLDQFADIFEYNCQEKIR